MSENVEQPEVEPEPEDRRAVGGDAARAAELAADMRAKSAPYAKAEFNSVDMYQVEREDDGTYIIKNMRTGNATPHSHKSHKSVIKMFREDPDYGEPLALLTDHEGAE